MDANYIILINKEAQPVLVEVPEKPKTAGWYESAIMAANSNYEHRIQQALSDTSKHIRFKDEDEIARTLKGANQQYKLPVGETFPLPSNVSVSFEDLCDCELSALKGSPAMCFVCLRPDEHKLAILTESTTKQEPLEDQKQEGKWISVSLPLPEKEVLAIGYQNEIIIGYISKGESRGYVCENDNEFLTQVTHWMPLPEPPTK